MAVKLNLQNTYDKKRNILTLIKRFRGAVVLDLANKLATESEMIHYAVINQHHHCLETMLILVSSLRICFSWFYLFMCLYLNDSTFLHALNALLSLGCFLRKNVV